MRLYEIIKESVEDKMRADTIGLLLSLQASKGETVPTSMVVRTLNDMGYSCTIDSVIPFLVDLPVVASADTSTIKIGQKEPMGSDGDMSSEESDQMTMDRLAQKGAE